VAPHPKTKILFTTLRLHGSLPASDSFGNHLTGGRHFVAMDRLLDQASSGPLYLQRPEIAEATAQAILYQQLAVERCDLHAFVVMPNHVHLLFTPQSNVVEIVSSIKAYSGRRANQMMGRVGQPFWHEGNYDRWVQDLHEFERIRLYIRNNPVQAGLVKKAAEYDWLHVFGEAAARETLASGR
jgi:REP-associated tyrosine transposase